MDNTSGPQGRIAQDKSIERQHAQTLFDSGHDDPPGYVPERDDVRLTGQIRRVFLAMHGRQWRTLWSIAQETGDPEASVSAQLRHLRKKKWGGHTVDRRHVVGGLFEYRVTPNRGED